MWGFLVEWNVLRDFFVDHSQLERFSMKFATELSLAVIKALKTFSLPQGTLPNLRSCRVPPEMRPAFERARGQPLVEENYNWVFKKAVEG